MERVQEILLFCLGGVCRHYHCKRTDIAISELITRIHLANKACQELFDRQLLVVKVEVEITLDCIHLYLVVAEPLLPLYLSFVIIAVETNQSPQLLERSGDILHLLTGGFVSDKTRLLARLLGPSNTCAGRKVIIIQVVWNYCDS